MLATDSFVEAMTIWGLSPSSDFQTFSAYSTMSLVWVELKDDLSSMTASSRIAMADRVLPTVIAKKGWSALM